MYSGESYINEFNMVYGVLSGYIKKAQIFVEDACLLSHGEMFEVRLSNSDYVEIASYSEELYKKNEFILGWYCSIPSKGTFFNTTNHANHLFFQSSNELAIAVVLHPETLENNNLQNYMKIYRLEKDLSENWIKLEYKITSEEEDIIINEMKEVCRDLYVIFDLRTLDEKKLNEYLRKSL